MAIGALLTPAGILAVRAESPYTALVLMGIVLFGFQVWINNLQTLPSDFFPKSAVASVFGLGGTAAAITRYLAGNTDPVTLAILRWGIGFLCVLPAALLLRAKWPERRDWPAVAAATTLFFVPILCFTILLRRHLLRGITFGAVRK